ncbi:MAG: Trp family transcriptional regulator [Patescibacteria group bacterium]
MANVIKKHLNKELSSKAWKNFVDVVKQSGSEESLVLNLKKFFTAKELAILEKRLAIPILLKQGLSYRSIGEIIDVGPNTISFVKSNLTKKPVVRRKNSLIQSDKTKNKSSHSGIFALSGQASRIRAAVNRSK